MSINKDLNVDPYYDDYDEKKQFNPSIEVIKSNY